MELITCEDFKITSSIKQQVFRKNNEILKYLKKEIPIHFFIKKTGSAVETIISLNYKGKSFSSHAKDKNFYKSLGQSNRKLVRQLRDWKKKREDSRKSTSLKEVCSDQREQEESIGA